MNAITNSADELTQVVDRESLSPDELELLDGFDRNETRLKGAYPVEFIDTKLLIANSFLTDISCILKMDSGTVNGFKSTVKEIAQSGSYSPLSIRTTIGHLEKAVRDFPIKNFTPESY
ncbi:hypothetical protein, partial [Pseudomonas sp. FW306-02-H05-AB]